MTQNLTPLTLYECRNLPLHWVGTDEAAAPWIFPAAHRGWERRTPYRGPPAALRSTPAYRSAIGTGFPGHQGDGRSGA